ncbi:hypothetical protein JQT77_01230 [Sulfitobacter mediterraneus]|uniref:hypothetical protein n=1 Tax=Sulfitobacter mediterraneus TaxID=83219 RepID=UPI00193948C6|nr:hypothetical protein [Sulfitobacter mediterraneus]MBM1321049.1 hypothetical protein [Sulfitobacter mediterraneus]MBM1431251.1 hypothetical protein [Sulfitobacter mediterraneus]MBM1439022.1 hypothetical protein [Sulfitobacter mediterraneus]MBM1501081.1 hypothetical protein [Sulfitobacter mediterraneus]MBM1547506.1 hypothetical protein [Sulfitobacter mediterraneus]
MADLQKLQMATRIAYQQRQHRFQTVLAEEARLRQEIQRLDGLDQQVREQFLQNQNMRAIGADVLWLGWVGRSKTAVNMELSRVLAVKEHHLSEVRKAYGKRLVAEQLLDQHEKEKRQTGAKRDLDRIIEISLFS